MQAVIMAAGASTRTHPLTLTRPKPLVPMWDRPLFEQQLRQLVGLVEEVVVVVGFLREQIESRFGARFEGIHLRYAVQQKQRGTADALLAARPLLSSRTLVLNGNDLCHRDDLAGLLQTGRGLLVARARDPQNRAVVSIDGGRVMGIEEKPLSPAADAWCSVGGYCFEEEDLAELDDLPESPRGELELPDLVLRLIRSHAVRPSFISRFWMPITYAWDVLGAALFLWEDPERARTLALRRDTLESLERRTDVLRRGEVEIEGPVWLGENVRLGRGVCLVGPTAIGRGCQIEDDVSIERSVLFEDVKVEDRCRVYDSVLGAAVSMGAGSHVESREGASLEIDVKGKRIAPEIPRLGIIAGDGVEIPEGATIPAGALLQR